MLFKILITFLSSIKSTDDSTLFEFENMNISAFNEDVQTTNSSESDKNSEFHIQNESFEILEKDLTYEQINLDLKIKKSYAIFFDCLKKINDLIKNTLEFIKNNENEAYKTIACENLWEVYKYHTKFKDENFRTLNILSTICNEIYEACGSHLFDHHPEDWKKFYKSCLMKLDEYGLITTLIKLLEDLEKSIPDPRFWFHREWIPRLIAIIDDHSYTETFDKGDFNGIIRYFNWNAEHLEKPYNLKDLHDINLGYPTFLESKKENLINFIYFNIRIWCYLNSTHFIFHDRILFERFKSFGDSPGRYDGVI